VLGRTRIHALHSAGSSDPIRDENGDRDVVWDRDGCLTNQYVPTVLGPLLEPQKLSTTSSLELSLHMLRRMGALSIGLAARAT